MFMLIFLFVIAGLFSSPLSFPCLTRESVKEMFGSRPNMTGKRSGMTEEKIILSLSGLTRQSRDPRNALRLSGDDTEEGSTGICKGDVRLKPKHDIEKKAEHNKEKRSNMTKNKAPLPRGFLFICCPATAY